jgi:hypothetical protein
MATSPTGYPFPPKPQPQPCAETEETEASQEPVPTSTIWDRMPKPEDCHPLLEDL